MANEKKIQKIKFNDDIYEGEVVGEVPHGKGKLTFKNGTGYYEGDFANGKFHGIGEFFIIDLIHAVGIWEEQKFLEGRVVYSGEWLYYCDCEPGTVYEGGFDNFFIEGKGKIIYPNGEIYEGAIFEGKRHGKGKLTLSDGTVIEGTWIYGSKTHEYTDEDYENAGGDAVFGEQRNDYDDTISEDEINSIFGTCKAPEESIILEEKRMEKFEYNDGIYEGEAVEKIPNGKGIITFKDGSRYEGIFINGVLTGQVKCTLDNGDVYEGEFEKDEPNGYGKMISTDGYIYEGTFLDGNFHGRGKLTHNDGYVIDGIWVDNEFIDYDTYSHINEIDENGTVKKITDAEIIEIYRCYMEAGKHMQANRFADELKILNKALRISPNNASTLIKIGRCYRNIGLLDNAIESYKKAIEIDPSFGVAYTNLGLAYFQNEQWLDAIAQYKIGLSLYDVKTDEYWMAYANYAIVIGKLGDLERAERMIAEAEQHGYKNGDACRIVLGIKK